VKSAEKDMSIEKLGVRENLSGRAFNICKYNGLTTLGSILRHYEVHGKFSNIRNCGVMANNELLSLVNKHKTLLSKPGNIEDKENGASEKNVHTLLCEMLKRNFKTSPRIAKKITSKNDLSKGIPIFTTLKLLIEEGLFFNDQERYVFKNNMAVFQNNQVEVLRKSADHLRITTERVRQIRNNTYEKLISKMALFKDIPLKYLDLHRLKKDDALPVVRLRYINEISDTEDVNFTTDLINLVLQIILEEEYSLIGNIQNKIFQKHVSGVYFWKHSYLISNNLSSCCDFPAFIQHIHNLKLEKAQKSKTIEINSLLKSYRNITNPVLQKLILETASYIVSMEFPDNYKEPGRIIIHRNTLKTLPEFIYETIQDAKEPLSIFEITKNIKNKYPNKNININSVKATCVKDPRFISMSHFKYALSEWEIESERIKGGSLRKLTTDFLATRPEPVHIDEIIKHIRKYRKGIFPGNLKTNLKLAGSSRFVFYPGDKVGLPGKGQ